MFQRKLTKCGLSNQGVMMKVVTELQCQSLIIRILTIPMKLKLSNWKQWVNNDIANSNHTVQNFKSTKSHNTQSRISANAQWDVRLNADIEWHYPTHQQKKTTFSIINKLSCSPVLLLKENNCSFTRPTLSSKHLFDAANGCPKN